MTESAGPRGRSSASRVGEGPADRTPYSLSAGNYADATDAHKLSAQHPTEEIVP